MTGKGAETESAPEGGSGVGPGALRAQALCTFFVRLFIHSFVRLFVRLFVHVFIHSFTCSFIGSFIHSFIQMFGFLSHLFLPLPDFGSS